MKLEPLGFGYWNETIIWRDVVVKSYKWVRRNVTIFQRNGVFTHEQGI